MHDTRVELKNVDGAVVAQAQEIDSPRTTLNIYCKEAKSLASGTPAAMAAAAVVAAVLAR